MDTQKTLPRELWLPNYPYISWALSHPNRKNHSLSPKDQVKDQVFKILFVSLPGYISVYMTIFQLVMFETNRITILSSPLQGTRQPKYSSNYHIIIHAFGFNNILSNQIYSHHWGSPDKIQGPDSGDCPQEEPMCQGNKVVVVLQFQTAVDPAICQDSAVCLDLVVVDSRRPSSFSPTPQTQQDSPGSEILDPTWLQA